MTYPQPPVPQAPQHKRHGVRNGCLIGTGVVGAAIILIIVIVAAVGGGGGTSPTTRSNPGGGGQPTHIAVPAAAGIGTPVRDGKFQFTITKVMYTKHAGGQFGSTAQGHYAVLHITVKNIGSESQTLDDSSQYAFANGRKFSASTEADIWLNHGADNVFLQDINPGNSVHGLIAFDMPRTLKPVKAELHDSMFSSGVSVSLR